jgi:hypothetical protein
LTCNQKVNYLGGFGGIQKGREQGGIVVLLCIIMVIEILSYLKRQVFSEIKSNCCYFDCILLMKESADYVETKKQYFYFGLYLVFMI